MRSTLHKLQALCDDRAAEVAALESANKSLRMRSASMQLAARLLAEIQRHHSLMSDDASELQLVRLQGIIACPGQGSSASAAAGGRANGSTAMWAPGLSASAGGLVERSSGSGLAYETAGSGDLLAAIPHLAPGRPLLRLEGVTREEVEAAKAMSLSELKARWTELVAEGRPHLDSEHTDPAAAAALSSVGLRMGRLLALACLWNLDAVFLKFMSSRTDGGEATLANRASAVVGSDCETAEDAEMGLWEACTRASRLTREQGQVIVAASDMFTSRLAALREERVRLSQELAVYTAEAAAAPHGSEEAHLSISAVLEDMQASTRNESCAFLLVAQMMRIILTPRQYASLWCRCYPWPIHQMACVAVIRDALNSDPSMFAASVADP